MVNKAAVSVLSLLLPALGSASNIWLFSGVSRATAPAAVESRPLASSELAFMGTRASKNHAASGEHCKKNWACSLALGVGYRHDKFIQRYTPSSSNSFQRVKFKYHGVDSVTELLRIDARYKDVLFNFEGDYAPVVSGRILAPFNTDPRTSDVFHFKFKKLSGYEADVMASIGYRLRFMHGCRSRAALVFQVGYRYSHQAWETEAQDRKRTTSFTSMLQDQAPAHIEWFGPFLEGRLSVSYRDFLYFEPFYQYYFLDYRSQRRESQFGFDYTGGTPPVPADFIVKYISQGDEARGQLGGIDLFYQAEDRHLRIGLKSTYLDFRSNDTKTTTRLVESFLNTNPPTKTLVKPKYHSHSKWESYTIAAYLGYSF